MSLHITVSSFIVNRLYFPSCFKKSFPVFTRFGAVHESSSAQRNLFNWRVTGWPPLLNAFVTEHFNSIMLPFKCHVACSSSSIPRPDGTYRDGWDLPQPTFAENNFRWEIFCVEIGLHYIKGSFNNYVDIILPFFDPPTPSAWTVFTLSVDKY